MQYQWAEDDFVLPDGVVRLDLPEPLSGKTYVMYHGTTRKAAQAIKATGFRQSAGGMLGRGVYLSRDLEKASRYPIDHPDSDKVVIRVKVNVGKVIAINRQDHPRQKTWHDPKYGDVYDTAWVPPKCGMVPSGLEEDCVWDPKRIQIIGTINPRPVQSPYPVQSPRPSQPFYGYSACGNTMSSSYSHTDTNMPYHWAEDSFKLPYGVGQRDLAEPLSDKTYVMYHGTTRKAAEAIKAKGFRQSKDGTLGRGVYLSRDPEKASRHLIDHPESDRVVIKVEVNVGKVIAIDHQDHPRQKNWHDSRRSEVYDTAWMPPQCGMKEGESCVRDPDRIKILDITEPRPLQPFGGWGAWGYM